MKNKTLILVLLATIAIPQMTSAAWWNPFDWFAFLKEIFAPKEIVIVQSVPATLPTISTTTVETTAKAVENKPKVVTKPVVTQKTVATNVIPSATTPPTSTTTTSDSQKEQELKLLQEQTELLRQQVEAQQVIAQNTTPTPIYVPPAQTDPIVTLGTPYCNQGDESKETSKIAINISDSGWEYGLAKAIPSNLPPSTTGSSVNFARRPIVPITIGVVNGWGTTTITVELGTEKKYWNSLTPITTYTFTDIINIENYCQ